MNPIGALPAVRPAILITPSGGDRNAGSFANALGQAIDATQRGIAHADEMSAALAAGRAGVADAAIARAKADVILEVAAVAASRVSAAITTLIQTQV